MTIAICDDERVERQQMKRLIRTQIPEADIQEYESGESVLASEQQFDIIFLDIKLHGMNGMETAKELRSKEWNAEIIFVTGLEEYVFEAFDVGAFHYLVKPIDKVKFWLVLKEALYLCEEKQHLRNSVKEQARKRLMVKTKTITRKVYADDIYYIEVQNRKVILHTKKESVEYYEKLTNLEKELGSSFFRCHRAYLVNLDFISSYDSTKIILEDDRRIPMPKHKYKEFVKAYMDYMKRTDMG